MVTPIASFRVLDNGIYHKTFAQLQLKRIDGEEELFIKYGNHKSFLPVSTMLRGGLIYLNAAMVGVFADIKLPVNQWIELLKRLKSTQKLEDWKYITNQLNKVA